MKKPELKQREWVRKHRKNLPQLHKEVCRRILVLRDKLWRGDPKPFACLLQGMLGQESPTGAMFNALIACWELKTPKLCFANHLNVLLVGSALSYFNRRHKNRPKVLAYPPLNCVPADCMHLLDFSPVELGRLLDEAIKVHGLGREFTLICKWLEATSFKPEPFPAGSLYMYRAETRRNNFLDGLYAPDRAGQLVGANVAKLHKMANRRFTPESEAFTERVSREFIQARATGLPLAKKYDAERLESLKVGVGVPWSGAGNTLAQLFFKWTQGDSSVYGLSMLQELLAQESLPVPEKGTPEEIYIMVKQIVARREHVQAVRGQKATDNATLTECRRKYTDMTLEQLVADCDGSGQHIEAALEEASEKLRRGREFARKLYKRASANAVTNKVWSEYLQQFSSF